MVNKGPGFAAAGNRVKMNGRHRGAADEIYFQSSSFETYLDSIIHAWLKVLTALAFTLVPIFLILDYVLTPREIFWQFLLYRVLSTLVVLAQFFIIRLTKPGLFSYVHGYILSFVVAGAIVQMTADLGGFDSSYYAGLNLVIIGVNLLLPWRAVHSAITSGTIIAGYVAVNLLQAQPFQTANLVNNLFFLTGTAVIAVSINYVKHRLIRQEYDLRSQLLEANSKLERSQADLKAARDALWGEMELAKRIQTAILPKSYESGHYQISAEMRPASEVGGDYYDVQERPDGTMWFSIGDVSGHGVTSGLIMMMAQTSLATMVQNGAADPVTAVRSANAVLSENIRRLEESKYMTLTVMKALPDGRITFYGQHQDLLIYRKERKVVEAIPTMGSWVGIPSVPDEGSPGPGRLRLGPGDVLLLYTDGVTEAKGLDGGLFGNERLIAALEACGDKSVLEIREDILACVGAHMNEQDDDIALLVIKKK